MSRESPRGPSERGSVTVWMVLIPMMLLVLGGMSVDLWASMSARSRIAAIADEAAAAGSTGVSDEGLRDGGADQGVRLDPEVARARALDSVDRHPESGLVTGRAVTATPDVVSVTVDGEYSFTFLRLVGATTAPIRVVGNAAPTLVN